MPPYAELQTIDMGIIHGAYDFHSFVNHEREISLTMSPIMLVTINSILSEKI